MNLNNLPIKDLKEASDIIIELNEGLKKRNKPASFVIQQNWVKPGTFNVVAVNIVGQSSIIFSGTVENTLIYLKGFQAGTLFESVLQGNVYEKNSSSDVVAGT